MSVAMDRGPGNVQTQSGDYPVCSRGLFPLPAVVKCGPNPALTANLNPDEFSFEFAVGSKSKNSAIMVSAFSRALEDLKNAPVVLARPGVAEPGIEKKNSNLNAEVSPGFSHGSKLSIQSLQVNVSVEFDGAGKTIESDESYELVIDVDPASSKVTATLTSTSVWGAIYGLTTFTQLFYPVPAGSNKLHTGSDKTSLTVDGLPIAITDRPRFPWRGVLLDTANHFFPLVDVLRTVDALSLNKYNVLHWHIVDSYSFPFQSAAYPGLGKGAWSPAAVYSPQDIRTVRDYALERGVRVVLEIDMPGHAYSWGLGVPNITVPCPDYGTDLDIGHVNAVPLDPSRDETYQVVDGLLRELVSLIDASENYLHLGGDEIEDGCWNASTSVVSWKNGLGLGSWAAVKRYFYRKVWDQTVNPMRKKAVTWEDLYLNSSSGVLDFKSPNVPFKPSEAVIEVWTDTKYLSQVVEAGYDGIYAAAWYLDRQQPVDGIVNWEWLDTMWQMYSVEPEEHVVPGSSGTVLGGEASMWSEQVDTHTLDARIWPRASAVAERLWSPKTCVDHEYAAWRLREHRCRMVARGIGAGPFWSEHCVSSTGFH